MQTADIFKNHLDNESSVEPVCPVFGICGGCLFQNVTYEKELELKEQYLKELLLGNLALSESLFEPIVASPAEYHSRSRLDLTIRRFKTDEPEMGFQLPGSKKMIGIDSCAIAKNEISDFIPALKYEAVKKLPEKYRTANIVVKTGDDGRVLWGGIGKGSLKMQPKDYLWTMIHDKRVYYSLDTFFQANLSILPSLIEKLEENIPADSRDLFFDLYSGVGLFGLPLAKRFKKVVMIEENPASIKLAKHNIEHWALKNVEVFSGRVEDYLPELLEQSGVTSPMAMIDPPRKGLSLAVAEFLAGLKQLKVLFYLSCHPESLVRDLKIFSEHDWKVKKIIPFDFFPKTRHLETLAILSQEK